MVFCRTLQVSHDGTAPELARLLEVTNGTITSFSSSGAWTLHPFARGFAFEPIVARMIGAFAELLPPGFPVIDIWRRSQGKVISIKSLDVTAQTYQTISSLTYTVNRYVDVVAEYAGQVPARSGVFIPPSDILAREVQLVIRPGASSAQQTALNNAVQRAASLTDPVSGLPNPVTLVIREIP